MLPLDKSVNAVRPKVRSPGRTTASWSPTDTSAGITSAEVMV